MSVANHFSRLVHLIAESPSLLPPHLLTQALPLPQGIGGQMFIVSPSNRTQIDSDGLTPIDAEPMELPSIKALSLSTGIEASKLAPVLVKSALLAREAMIACDRMTEASMFQRIASTYGGPQAEFLPRSNSHPLRDLAIILRPEATLKKIGDRARAQLSESIQKPANARAVFGS